MQDADFCIAPLGQHGGDPDRYVASVLFGCIPILLGSAFMHNPVPMALPLEEVVAWHRFATIVDVANIDKLDAQLRCLAPIVPALRANAAPRWHWLLYSSIFGSYLGEKPGNDAFEAIMRILAQRAVHGYRPPPNVMWRMQNRHELFPCMQPNSNATVLANWMAMQKLGWSHMRGAGGHGSKAGGSHAGNNTAALRGLHLRRLQRQQRRRSRQL